jgi:hypothetical protein
MNTLKIIITFTLLVLITSTANAAGSVAEKTCVRADLTGRWTVIMNETGGVVGPFATQRCTMIINSVGILTLGTCIDIESSGMWASQTNPPPKATIDAQCNVSFSFVSSHLVRSKAIGAINRGRDVIVGTFKEKAGNFGTFSAVKY